jgi:hypothetical protein
LRKEKPRFERSGVLGKDLGDDLLQSAAARRTATMWVRISPSVPQAPRGQDHRKNAIKRQNPSSMSWGFAFIKTLAMTYSCMA